MYLLDSDICIEYTRRNPIVYSRFRKNALEEIGVSVITVGELLLGTFRASDPSRVKQDIDQLLLRTKQWPLTEDVPYWYANIRHTLQRRGQIIGAKDLWIAAHALSLDLTLVTNNERELPRVPNLRIENWTKPA